MIDSRNAAIGSYLKNRGAVLVVPRAPLTTGVKYVVSLMALYMHFGPFSRYVVGRLEEQIASIDSGVWKAPTAVCLARTASALPASSEENGREAVGF